MNSPICAAFSSEIDFQTALARLLRDGALRDLFARDRTAAIASLGAHRDEESMLAQLDAEDMEFQAQVLLRKRFSALRRLLPVTLARLGDRAWPLFADFARTHWRPSAPHDAAAFCRHLSSSASTRELHRAEFIAEGRRFAVHVLPREWAVQVIFRFRGRTREWCARLFADMPRA